MIVEKCENWRPVGISIQSADDDYCIDAARIVLYAFGRRVEWRIPQIIKPWRRWVDTSRYEWAGPNGGYWDVHPTEYGFRISDGFLQVFLGPQTMDSQTTKSWCKHLPWTQWRHVRFSLYGLQGNHFWTQWDKGERFSDRFEKQREAQEACPKVAFSVDDYDGKRIQATTHIEEREWRFGEGWFKWLSLFRKPMVKRRLELHFSEEVGPEKGSWKGGLMGTSIEMLPGELHESAFRRYCEQEHRAKHGRYRIKFVDPVVA